MNQPIITCPHCEAEITLNEPLAISRIQAKLAEKEAEIARRESALLTKRAELAKAVELIEQQFTAPLESERERIAAEEAEKARLLWATGLESKSREVADLQRELQKRDHKLAEAAGAQTELIRKQQELVHANQSIQDSMHQATREAGDALKLEISKKEEQIASLQRQLEGMELVSQYLTGPGFGERIATIVEKFSAMQTDLDRERKTMTRLRAKREEQIKGVIESTVGMYNDLQEITGKTLGEIHGLVQIARRLEARRKRGLAPRRVPEPIVTRDRTH